MSKANVEKVVNEPKNPIIRKIFKFSDSINLFSNKLTTRPIKKHPIKFTIKIPIGGTARDLNKTKNCVKITGYVNSTDDFIDQPKVINPASEILSQTFGEKGKHSRAAVSVNSLPLGAAVEIDSIFEI